MLFYIDAENSKIYIDIEKNVGVGFLQEPHSGKIETEK